MKLRVLYSIMVLGKRYPLEEGIKELRMRHVKKLVFAVVAAVVATMVFAGPAFAESEGSCLHVPLSPMSAAALPMTFPALMIQLALAVGIAVVAVVALAPAYIFGSPASTGTTQTAT